MFVLVRLFILPYIEENEQTNGNSHCTLDFFTTSFLLECGGDFAAPQRKNISSTEENMLSGNCYFSRANVSLMRRRASVMFSSLVA